MKFCKLSAFPHSSKYLSRSCLCNLIQETALSISLTSWKSTTHNWTAVGRNSGARRPPTACERCRRGRRAWRSPPCGARFGNSPWPSGRSCGAPECSWATSIRSKSWSHSNGRRKSGADGGIILRIAMKTYTGIDHHKQYSVARTLDAQGRKVASGAAPTNVSCETMLVLKPAWVSSAVR